MKLKVAAILLGLCIAESASAQIVIVTRPGFFVLPPPGPVLIKVKMPGGPLPVLGGGYGQDTRGVDLDVVSPKKPHPRDAMEPGPKYGEADSGKPWPGVEVSKSRAPDRPGDPVKEIKPAPKKQPPPPPRPRPEPQKPLADPLLENARLMELGLRAFEVGDYGLATQRFGKAVEVAPKQPRAYFLLAQAEFAMANYREAVATIQAGMKIEKVWPRTPVQPRLDLYKGRDADYTDHLKRLTDSVAAHPNHPTLLFLMAHQLWFDGRRADALALFQRARPLTSDPTFVDVFLAAGGPGDLAAK